VRRSILGLTALCALLAASLAAATAHGYALKTMSTDVHAPGPLVAARAGAMWLLDGGDDEQVTWSGIDLVASDGTLTHVTSPFPAGARLRFPASAADGGVWVYDLAHRTLDHLSPAGALTQQALGGVLGVVGDVGGVAVGADGRPWVLVSTFSSGFQLVRLNGDGTVLRVTLGTQIDAPWTARTVVAGTDGRIWVGSYGAVVSVSSTGAVRVHKLLRVPPASQTYPLTVALAAAPGGGVAVSTFGPDVYRQGTTGPARRVARVRGETPAYRNEATALAYGAGRRLWLLAGTSQIVEVAPSGRVVKRGPGVPDVLGVPALQPIDAAADTRGRVWVTSTAGSTARLSRIVSTLACQVPAVTGRTLAAARRLFRAGGCRVRVVYGHRRGDGPVRVVAQGAKPERVLTYRSHVTLTLAHVSDVCRYDATGWWIRASTKQAVLAARTVTPATGPIEGSIEACGFSSRQRWTVERWTLDRDYQRDEIVAAASGPWLAYAHTVTSEQGHGASATSTLRVIDVRGRLVHAVAADPDAAPMSPGLASSVVRTVAVDDGGDLLWESFSFADAPESGAPFVPDRALHVRSADGAERTLVRGPQTMRLDALQIDGTTVRWMQNGVARSAPVHAGR
jgi:hypothetical protein